MEYLKNPLPNKPEQEHNRSPSSGRFHWYLILFLGLCYITGQGMEWYRNWEIGMNLGLSMVRIQTDLEVWRFLSYGLFHNYLPLFVANILICWLLCPRVEQVWGPIRVGILFVFSSVLAGLCTFLLSDPEGFLGATGGILGICVVHLLYFPHRRILNRVEVRYGIWGIMAVLVGIHYFTDTGGAPQGALAQIGGAGAGWLFVKIEPFLDRALKAWRRWQRKKRKIEEKRIKKKVEELLDKIADEGMDELTWREKSFLKQASKHFDDESTSDKD